MYDFLWHVFRIKFLLWCQNHFGHSENMVYIPHELIQYALWNYFHHQILQDKVHICKGYCFHEDILCADGKKMFFQQIYFFSFKITLWTFWKYGWFSVTCFYSKFSCLVSKWHSGHSENMYDFLWHVFRINFLLWCQNHTLDILKIWFISPMN